MIKMFRHAIFFLASFFLVNAAFATACSSHELYSVFLGPTGEMLVAGTFGFVRSDDFGETWTEAKVPGSVLAPHRRGEDLFLRAATDAYRSQDLGRTWVQVPRDRPFSLADKQGRLYACSSKDENRVEISENGGVSWKASERLNKSDINAVAEILYDGLEEGQVRSFLMVKDINGHLTRTDARGNWGLSNNNRTPCSDVTVVGDMLYILNERTLFRSADHGWHWNATRLIDDFELYLSKPTRLFYDTEGTLYINPYTIYRSRDHGLTWHPVNFVLSSGIELRHPKLLAIGNDSLFFFENEGQRFNLYRSADGVNAIPLIDPWMNMRIGELPLHHQDFLYEKLAASNGRIAILGSKGIAFSGDDGMTWKLIEGPRMTTAEWTRCSG